MSNVIASLRISTAIDLSGFNRDLRRMQEMGDRASREMARNMAAAMGDASRNVGGGGFNAAGSRAATQFSQGFTRQISAESSRMNSVITGVFQGVGQQITSVLTTAIAGAINQVGNFSQAMIAAGTSAENTAVTFEVLLGSASKAKATLADLATFAQTTPFELPQVTQAAKNLLAFGVEAQDLKSTLTNLGNVASALNIPLTEIADIYGKAKVQGRLFAEDINQLTGRGVPIIQELAKQFGVTDSEVKKLVEDGKVGFAQLEKAFVSMSAEGGKFEGLMDRLSKTTAGKWSNISDQIGRSLVAAFDSVSPAINALLDAASSAFSGIQVDLSAISDEARRFADYLKENPEAVQATAALISGALTESIKAMAAAMQTAMSATKGTLDYFEKYPATLKAIEGTVNLIGEGYKLWGSILSIIPNALGEISKALEPVLESAQRIGQAIANWWTNGGNSNASSTSGGTVSQLREAIIGKESNGNPRAVNPHSGALGLGQVMPANVPSWTKEALGRSLTPQQFLNDTEAQLKTIEFKLNQMLQKYLKQTGNDLEKAVRMVAAEWYSGRGELYNSTRAEANGYPSIAAYTRDVWRRYQRAAPPDQGTGYTVTTKNEKPTYPGKNLASAGTQQGQHFGAGRNRNGKPGTHEGMDEAMPAGTPITAPWDGQVKTVTTSDGEIWLVLETKDSAGNVHNVRLGHLSATNLKPGDSISAGQEVAKSGSHHVHIETRVNGKLQDPKDYFKGGSLASPVTADSINRDRDRAEAEAKRAADEARRLTESRDRAHAEKIQSDRRLRDQQYAQDTERGRIGLEGYPLDVYNQKREGGAKLQELYDQRADLETARKIKVRDKLEGGVDYTAAIANLTKLIDGQKQLNAELDSQRTKEEWQRVNEVRQNEAIEAKNRLNALSITLQERESERVMQTLDYQQRRINFEKTITELTAQSRQRQLELNESIISSQQGLQRVLDETWEKTHRLEIGLIEGVGGAFQSAISQAITGTQSLGEIALNMLNQIASQLASLALDSIFGNAREGTGILGGLTKSLFGGAMEIFNPRAAMIGSLRDYRDFGVPAFADGGFTGNYEGLAYLHKNEIVAPLEKVDQVFDNKQVVINSNVSVTNHGGAGTDERQAERIGKEVERNIRKVVQSEILRRSGGRFA